MNSSQEWCEMERTYKFCLIGRFSPNMGIASGTYLLRLDPTLEVETDKIYFISSEGIKEIERED